MGSFVGWRRRRLARIAQLAARVNSPHGGGVRRIDDLIKTVKKWREAISSKYTPSSPWSNQAPRGDLEDGESREASDRDDKEQCGAL